jgi:hypothetical protein
MLDLLFNPKFVAMVTMVIVTAIAIIHVHQELEKVNHE